MFQRYLRFGVWQRDLERGHELARRLRRVVAQWVAEMKRVQGAHANAAAAMLCFVTIDAMAHIGRATDAAKTINIDFKAWVDNYMRSDEPAEYRYSVDDLYAARCDVLHTFSNQIRSSNRAKR